MKQSELYNAVQKFQKADKALSELSNSFQKFNSSVSEIEDIKALLNKTANHFADFSREVGGVKKENIELCKKHNELMRGIEESSNKFFANLDTRLKGTSQDIDKQFALELRELKKHVAHSLEVVNEFEKDVKKVRSSKYFTEYQNDKETVNQVLRTLQEQIHSTRLAIVCEVKAVGEQIHAVEKQISAVRAATVDEVKVVYEIIQFGIENQHSYHVEQYKAIREELEKLSSVCAENFKSVEYMRMDMRGFKYHIGDFTLGGWSVDMRGFFWIMMVTQVVVLLLVLFKR